MAKLPLESQHSTARVDASPSDLRDKNHIIAALPEAEYQLVLKHSQLVHLHSDETLYRQGDLIGVVFFPIDAVMSSFTIMEDGAMVEVYMTGSEGMVGLAPFIGDNETMNWTNVQIAGDALRLSHRILMEGYRRNDYIRRALLQSYRSLQVQIARRAVCNARHTIVKRLACWLLMIHDRAGRNDLNLTHEVIASRLGARRSGITEAANLIQSAAGIDYRRGRIVIRNRKAIERLACECYELLSLPPPSVREISRSRHKARLSRPFGLSREWERFDK